MKSLFFISILSCIGINAILKELPDPYCNLNVLHPFDPHGYYINEKQLNKVIYEKKPKIMIELGTWLGMSTRSIASQIPDGCIFYTVDHFLGSNEAAHQIQNADKIPLLYEKFLSNVIHAGLCHKIRPLRMTTLDAAEYFKKNQIKADIIYVDASHDFDSVYKDLVTYLPLLNDEGILCGDDWGWGDDLPVQRAVIKFANENNFYVDIGDNFWFWKLTKKKPISASKSIQIIAPFCPRTWPDGMDNIYSKYDVVCSCPTHTDFSKLSLNFNQYDKYFFFDLNINTMLDKQYVKKNVLFHCEPRNYNTAFFNNFDRVYTWNDDLVDNQKFFKFYYPYLTPMMENLPEFSDKKFCCMIVSNWQIHRLECVEFFKDHSSFLDIYGSGLPYPYNQFDNYLGPIKGHHSGSEKYDTLKKYKFCMCFENTVGLRGYISEKILACFTSGCIPVYWGADNVTDYIPENCFIDFRKFKDYSELLDHIRSLSENEYQEYLKNIRLFLSSDKAKVFSVKSFNDLMEEAVNYSSM